MTHHQRLESLWIQVLHYALSIKYVWLYFGKMNCNSSESGRWLVHVDFSAADSSQRKKLEKSLWRKIICTHQYLYLPFQSSTAERIHVQIFHYSPLTPTHSYCEARCKSYLNKDLSPKSLHFTKNRNIRRLKLKMS